MTPTKENIDKLIEVLADKTLSFGCRVLTRKKYPASPAPFNPEGKDMELEMEQIVWESKDHPTSLFKVIYTIGGGIYGEQEIVQNYGHPILIGDVLSKLVEKQRCVIGDATHELLYRWNECGFTKSLQQILSEGRWEERPNCTKDHGFGVHCGGRLCGKTKSLSDPVRSLVSFLVSLFLSDNK